MCVCVCGCKEARGSRLTGAECRRRRHDLMEGEPIVTLLHRPRVLRELVHHVTVELTKRRHRPRRPPRPRHPRCPLLRPLLRLRPCGHGVVVVVRWR